MADELFENLNIRATLIPGGGGIFDVHVDGRRVYSKAETGRFPNAGEVTERIKTMS